MEYRNEWKHEIGYSDMISLRSRLSAVMQRDKHIIDGKYEIRSLYFDDIYDKALREKVNGINLRDKYRIRYYNGDLSYIVLEKKSKIDGLCKKLQTNLTVEQAAALSAGKYEAIADSTDALIRELYRKMQTENLRPKTIVDYTREPFVYAPGNVRVTLDYNIRTGLNRTDFLNPDVVTIPAGDAPIILEVKWDTFLPSVIRDIVQTPQTHTSSFSKYENCRIYG